MTRRQLLELRRKIQRALAAAFGGLAFACSSPPNEAPPLGPHPKPGPIGTPVPGAGDATRDPKIPAPKFPPPDAGVPGEPPPITAPGFVGDLDRDPTPIPAAVDAGVPDAGLPPIPDASVPADAPSVPLSDAR